MSHEIDDLPPPPSGEVAGFLFRHARTGEPSAADLARLRPLVTGEPTDAQLERVRERVASPTPLPRRSFVPPELLAAAAVVLLAVLLQLLYLAVRDKPEPTVANGADAVMAAYRAGDLEGARRLAGSSCTDANCASMSAKLLRAMELAGRFDALDDAELDELARLDASLSGGVATELTDAIARRRVNKGVDPSAFQKEDQSAGDGALRAADALYAEARALDRENKRAEAIAMVEKCLSFAPEHRECAALLKQLAPQPPLGDLIAEIDAERKARNFDRAVSLGEKCIRAYPQAATCYRQLGSNYAALATRDQSATDMEKAKKYYQRFLEVAPPDDEYVPKVKAVLGQAEDGAASPRNQTAPLTQIFELAMRLKEKNPTEAARYFQLVAESGEAPPALAEQARQELAALRPQADARDTYQRGYQLRESDPGEAARLFKDVMAQTSPDSELHQKAKTRLAELTPSADAPASVAVKLEVGHQKVLNFPGMVRVAVGDPNVVEVKTIGSSQLLLIGASVGSTTLQVWMSSGERASHLVTVSK